MDCGTLRRQGAEGSGEPLHGLGQHSGNLVLHFSGLRCGETVAGVQHYVKAGRQHMPVLADGFAQQALAAVPDDGVADLSRDRKAYPGRALGSGCQREDRD